MTPQERKIVGELVRQAKLERMESTGYRICASLSCDVDFEITRADRMYCTESCRKRATDLKRYRTKPRTPEQRARDLAKKRERYYKKRQENPSLSGREAHRVTG